MTRRVRDFYGMQIPSATRWELHTCGHCPNIHIVLFDDKDFPFAEMILGKDTLDALYRTGNKVLADIFRANVHKQNEEK